MAVSAGGLSARDSGCSPDSPRGPGTGGKEGGRARSRGRGKRAPITHPTCGRPVRGACGEQSGSSAGTHGPGAQRGHGGHPGTAGPAGTRRQSGGTAEPSRPAGQRGAKPGEGGREARRQRGQPGATRAHRPARAASPEPGYGGGKETPRRRLRS